MALPKQQLAIFQTTIPSTGQKIKFRGFTVKEEKALLLAQETDDPQVTISAIEEVLSACIQDEVDLKELAHFDIEFLITLIRAKSVGEIIELSLACDVDPNHKRIPALIDISKITVNIPKEHKKVINLYDDVGVTMRYPTAHEIAKFKEITGHDAVVMCIENIFTDDEVFDAKDQTPEELSEFVDGLTKKQLKKIEDEFFRTMPTYEYDLEYKCMDCGHVHRKVIKGLSSFFV